MNSLIKSVNPKYWSSYLRDIGFQSKGNILAQIINLISMPLITRLFSPEIFGRYAIAGQLIAGISIFLSFRLEYFIVSNNSIEAADRHLKLIIRNSLLKFISLLVFIILLSCFEVSILDFSTFEIFLILILSWTINISIAFQSITQYQKQFKASGNAEIYNKGSFALFSIFLGSIIPSLPIYLLSLISGFASKTIFLIKKIKFRIRQEFIHLHVSKDIRNKAYSLSIIGGLQFFVGFIPLYYLNLEFSLEQVGYFNIATTLLFLPVGIIANAIGQVYFQRISNYFNDNKGYAIYRITKSTVTSSAFISFILFAVIYFVANYIDIFLGSAWKDSAEIIKLFCFSSFLSFTSITIDKLNFVLRKTIYPIAVNLLRLISVCGTIYYSMVKDYNFVEFMRFYVIQLCIIYVIEIFISIAFARQYYKSQK